MDPALPERLADRLCHDVLSSAQAIASGLDLLAEAAGAAERDEAVAFLIEAVAAQRAKVGYARRAYGPAGDGVQTAELKGLAEALYADIRPTLDWAVEPAALGPAAARGLLVLLQIAADALAAGGRATATARAEGGHTRVEVDVAGPRAVVKEDVRSGLSGAPFQAALGGRWIQGAWVASLAAAAGGTVSVETYEGGLRLILILPPGT
jgi:histidine phosphotransferase ChpT